MQETLFYILGNSAFLLTAISFYVRDMLRLRLLAIAAGLMGIGFNYLVPTGPHWLIIFWLAVFTVINGSRVLLLYRESRGIRFSEEEQELFETQFRQFSAVEFMKLMRLARWRDAPAGEVLAVEGEPLGELKLIYNGEVEVKRAGEPIGLARDGALVGEMSFIQGGPATATVRTLQPTRYVAWAFPELRRLLRRNPTMDTTMKTVFSIDLIRKLGGAAAAPAPGVG